MARLTFPTAADLRASLTPGKGQQVDTYGHATLAADGSLSVSLTDASGATLQVLQPSTGAWTLTASQPDRHGQPLTLPEALIARANRLMQADGVSVQRDWRTKSHVLRAAPRRVLPMIGGATVSALTGPDGTWSAVPGVAASQPQPQPDPFGVTAPEAEDSQQHAADPTPEGQPAPSAAMPLQGIPALYRGKVVLSAEARAKWAMGRALNRAGQPSLMAFVGPSGAGKTHAVHALAAEEGMDVVKFDASGVIEPGDWFGTVTLDGKGTRFVPSDLLLAITLPGRRVLLLDEVNRAALRSLNAMLPVFDGSGTVTIPQSGKRERLNPEVQIVVTANIGSTFLGTEPLDEAIRTRVAVWVEVGHLSESDERQLLLDRVEGLTDYHATQLARLGALVRESSQSGAHAPVSTRQLLAAAWGIVSGTDPKVAVTGSVLDGYSDEGGSASERAKVRVHVHGIAWREPKPGQVFTGAPGGLCQCGHDAASHGIGEAVSPSTHCRTCVRNSPGQSGDGTCLTYDPVTVPVQD